MAGNPFRQVLGQPCEPGSEIAGWQAVATLYHNFFTGLILTVASRRGARDVGDWMFRVFRRQHREKFLSSFGKLGLGGLPDAVASAQYHYLSNMIGGVEVEYMYEADDKAWLRFCHPRWIYDRAAICAVPVEAGQGYIRGWYAENGVSLGNPRLGFVCTSQDTTLQYGFAGYFREYDRDLAPEERYSFAPDEVPPPFDPSATPVLDSGDWPAARLHKANRNYAMDYLRNGLPELVAAFGPGDAAALGRHAAYLIGAQFHGRVARLLGLDRPGAEGFAAFMVAIASASGDRAEWSRDDEAAVVRQSGWRLAGGVAHPNPALFEAWNGLWQGALASHDRFLLLDVRSRADRGDPVFEWRIRPRP
ncbi:hypothetical protein [Oceanibacterium hippocampi]|uniref:Uncharacterized protein n=1 Tax=Oceanibacterium hippocampi TaxID=745714 RepID=A0A1Y5TXT7_9PROT|nr:hypothetical protein [Oceanibacterium hippocampi]SLN76121.1 hypothetical protein OCH7691_04044 [Oceanibacterium hippocampi]